MSLSTNSGSHSANTSTNYSNQQHGSSSYSGSSFSSTGPRYNNNDVFDGYHLLRRNNRSNNYSSYAEGDSYRAQHIPALMENGGAKHSHNSSWSNSSYSQSASQSHQQSYYPNQQWNQWNQYNSAMYYQGSYQQQYPSSSNTGFVPPLPKGPPPPAPR